MRVDKECGIAGLRRFEKKENKIVISFRRRIWLEGFGRNEGGGWNDGQQDATIKQRLAPLSLPTRAGHF